MTEDRETFLPGDVTRYVASKPSQLDRIETKLDFLIAALAEEDEEQPTLTLDGEQDGGERDQSQSL